jgi:F-type H+-transporting ATPase subunit epsilon
MNTIHVDVVSAEESIFSGEARFVALPGEAGELGIYPRHTPLITRIKAGSVRIEMADGGEEFVFVAGGILEVQPNCVTVLSDTAIRGKDLDDEKANEARCNAINEQELAMGHIRTGHDGGPVVGVAKVPRQQVSERLSCRARHFLRSKKPRPSGRGFCLWRDGGTIGGSRVG